MSEGPYQAESRLEGFDGVEYVGEGWSSSRGHLRTVGVVNIVVTAIQQIQEFSRNAPSMVEPVGNLSVEQRRFL
jgi:hypothetical protein